MQGMRRDAESAHNAPDWRLRPLLLARDVAAPRPPCPGLLAARRISCAAKLLPLVPTGQVWDLPVHGIVTTSHGGSEAL